MREAEASVDAVSAELQQEHAQHASAVLANTTFSRMLEYKEELIRALRTAHEVGARRTERACEAGAVQHSARRHWRKHGAGWVMVGDTSATEGGRGVHRMELGQVLSEATPPAAEGY
jgi:hypothetical protein